MGRMVEFKETVWQITAHRGMATGSRSPEGGSPPMPTSPGLWFYSDNGERRFLRMSNSELPSDEELQDMPLDQTIELLKRAQLISK